MLALAALQHGSAALQRCNATSAGWVQATPLLVGELAQQRPDECSELGDRDHDGHVAEDTECPQLREPELSRVGHRR